MLYESKLVRQSEFFFFLLKPPPPQSPPFPHPPLFLPPPPLQFQTPRRPVLSPMRSRLTPKFSSSVRCKFARDRKSTRLNSSHSQISYAVFCLKKKIPRADRRWKNLPRAKTCRIHVRRSRCVDSDRHVRVHGKIHRLAFDRITAGLCRL